MLASQRCITPRNAVAHETNATMAPVATAATEDDDENGDDDDTIANLSRRP